MDRTKLNRRDLLIGTGMALGASALAGAPVLAGASAAGNSAAAGGSSKATGSADKGSGAAGKKLVAADAAGTITIGGDLKVNRLGYGAMRLCGPGVWGDSDDPASVPVVLRRALELGVNFIDTAEAYGPDVNERQIAAALHPYSKGLIIATKCGTDRPSRDQWVANGRPERLRAACEGSLKKLKVERIDLYQLHRADPNVPFEDTIGELAKLKQEGKIRHVGLSNVSVEQLAAARKIVDIVSVQNRYNVADRRSDAVLAVCERDGIAFIPYAPLSQSGRDAESKSRAALEAWATREGVSLPQAALAWLLARSPVMLPIPGTSKVKHLEENVAAAALRLSKEDLAAIG